MKLRLTGYEVASQQQYQQDLMDYATSGAMRGESPPPAAKPVYADGEGNHYVALPHNDGVTALPFIPGSAAVNTESPTGVSDNGGFVPLENMPQGGDGGDVVDVMKNVAQSMPQQLATNWMGGAARNLMMGAGTGGMMDAALQTLGVSNPLASGPMGQFLGAAMNTAGLGQLTPMLSGLGNPLAGLTDGVDPRNIADVPLVTATA